MPLRSPAARPAYAKQGQNPKQFLMHKILRCFEAGFPEASRAVPTRSACAKFLRPATAARAILPGWPLPVSSTTMKSRSTPAWSAPSWTGRCRSYRDLPVRPLDSSGSSNALFRLGRRPPDPAAPAGRRVGDNREGSQVDPAAGAVAAGRGSRGDRRLRTRPRLPGTAGQWSAGSTVNIRRWSLRIRPADPRRRCARRRPGRGCQCPEPGRSTGRGEPTTRSLRWYRGEPLAEIDSVTRRNIERCRALGDFGFDLDAAAAAMGRSHQAPRRERPASAQVVPRRPGRREPAAAGRPGVRPAPGRRPGLRRPGDRRTPPST